MHRQYEIQIRVRYDDADPMGYLHHARYFTYFEMGRIELLRKSGGNHRSMEDDGLFAVVVKAECRYHKPARYDDLLRIRTRIAKMTTAKIVHEYSAWREETLLAEATVTLALVDRQGQVQRIPDWMQPDASTEV